MLLDHRRPAVFLPADPPREGRLALYGAGSDEIELALPAGRTIRRKTAGDCDLTPPAGLNATLRPYQQRGLAWLAQMCDLGLGGCLADDMVLGNWQPDAEALTEGRAALSRLGVTRVWRNRITCGPVQLRLGPDGQWYRLVRSGTGWDLDAPPDPDPAALFIPDR